jgi:hypothetical protein
MQRLFLFINQRTFLVVVLAVISTWVCDTYELYGNFSVTFLLTPVIFPIVFSIHSAYERREHALNDYATLKSNSRSIFYALRDWLPHPQYTSLTELQRRLTHLFENIAVLLTGDYGSYAQNQIRVYESFSEISKFIRSDMRMKNLGETEISRVNSYLHNMLQAFESMQHICQYRTPKTLKMFGNLFAAVVPIIYGPYFAHEGHVYADGLQFVMPVMIAVLLTALINIQSQLENPFDQFGEDDIVFDTDAFIASLRSEHQHGHNNFLSSPSSKQTAASQ